MFHANKARAYYLKLEAIERKEGLIGFKTKNDNRTESDSYQIDLSLTPKEEQYFID